MIDFHRFLYVISKKMCRVTAMAHFMIAHCLCHGRSIIFRVEFIILCFSTDYFVYFVVNHGWVARNADFSVFLVKLLNFIDFYM